MKILMTGATGFIGSHLLPNLVARGNEVHVIARSNENLGRVAACTIHVHDGTIENLIEIVGGTRPDVVVHLASHFLPQHTPQDITALINSNLLFPTQLLEAMSKHCITRLVNTGTSWQHFANAEYNPVCLYAATKQAFEALLYFYVETAGLRAITLKLFDTYGPRDTRRKLFHFLSSASCAATPLDMSPGDQLLDLVYIDDVVSAFVLAIERLIENLVRGSEIYAVSSGAPLQLREIVAKYIHVTKRTLNIRWGGRPYRAREVMIPWNTGPRLQGWQPRISLEEGIKRTEETDVST